MGKDNPETKIKCSTTDGTLDRTFLFSPDMDDFQAFGPPSSVSRVRGYDYPVFPALKKEYSDEEVSGTYKNESITRDDTVVVRGKDTPSIFSSSMKQTNVSSGMPSDETATVSDDLEGRKKTFLLNKSKEYYKSLRQNLETPLANFIFFGINQSLSGITDKAGKTSGLGFAGSRAFLYYMQSRGLYPSELQGIGPQEGDYSEITITFINKNQARISIYNPWNNLRNSADGTTTPISSSTTVEFTVTLKKNLFGKSYFHVDPPTYSMGNPPVK